MGRRGMALEGRAWRSSRLVTATGLVVLLALAGCTSPKNALGTSTSPCFRALPVAHDALAGRGKLLGVKYLTVRAIDQDLARTKQRSAFVARVISKVHGPICIVGYQGDFRARTLSHTWPPGRSSARYALALVDQRRDQLLLIVLLARPPLRLSKL